MKTKLLQQVRKRYFIISVKVGFYRERKIFKYLILDLKKKTYEETGISMKDVIHGIIEKSIGSVLFQFLLLKNENKKQKRIFKTLLIQYNLKFRK